MSRFPGRQTKHAYLSALLLLAWGCRPATEPTAPALPPAEHKASQEISSELTRIINEAQIKYWPLRYDYAEDLLDRLDRIEAMLAGDKGGKAPRFLPKLDEAEERAHFRETVRRWEAQTGKKFRAEIDRLKASVASRKPGERFHPEFQKDFSATFNDLIKLEVLELRERRNRAIHEAAAPQFARYRENFPQLVKRFEADLEKPEYSLPAKTR